MVSRNIWLGDMPISDLIDQYFLVFPVAISMGTLYYLQLQLGEIKQDRRQMILENEKDRRTSHLSEQLDFYSALKGKMEKLSDVPREYPKFTTRLHSGFDSALVELAVDLYYHKWAFDKLRKKLEVYFTNMRIFSHALVYFSEQGKEPHEELMAFIDSIIKNIDKDHKKIVNQYRSFTSMST
jgi:hypothetical protein